jgi:hypothetical protein
MDGYNADLLMGLVGELNMLGLVHLRGDGITGYDDEQRKYSNHIVETTPLRYRFKTFILDPGSIGPASPPHGAPGLG